MRGGLLYVAVFAVAPLISTFVERLGISHAEAGLLISIFSLTYAVAKRTSRLRSPSASPRR